MLCARVFEPVPTALLQPTLALSTGQVRGQHFQVACGKYFEAKHKGTTLIETEMGGIVHPNQYFEESIKFHSLQAQKAGTGKFATVSGQVSTEAAEIAPSS